MYTSSVILLLACLRSSCTVLHIFAICLEQSAEGMTKGVPSDSFIYAVCPRNRTDMVLHEVVRPKRLFAVAVESAHSARS